MKVPTRGYAVIGLYNPKTIYNVGAVLRAAYAFEAASVYVSGLRYKKAGTDTVAGYTTFPLVQVSDLMSVIPFECSPIAVEISPHAKPLETYPHPPRAYYIFGPEDGRLPDRILQSCRDVVRIPSKVCVNLAAAVNIVLYDRAAKRGGGEPRPMSEGHRLRLTKKEATNGAARSGEDVQDPDLSESVREELIGALERRYGL